MLKKTKLEDKKDWDNSNYVVGKGSAREMPIGYVKSFGFRKKFMLRDKFLCKPNLCYFCGSSNSFHKRQQDLKDVAGNVWRIERENNDAEFFIKKWDFCLDCGKEFLIEYFIFTRIY